MKRILCLLTLCVTMIVSAQAQIRKVPAEVTTSFKTAFPNAKSVEWKDKLTFFRAEFKNAGISTSADFSSKGEWQSTEKALTYAQAPAAVKDGFKKSKYADPADWKVGETVTEITKNDKSTQYRVYVDKKGGVQKKYLFFAPDGQLEKESLTL